MTHRGGARARAAVLIAVALAIAIGPAGIGQGTASAQSARSRPPEQFSGSVDDFYKVPQPLTRARPGALIRIQDLGTSAGAHTVRVMYHSRDVGGHDRAVTGIITFPTARAPRRGWSVVSWAHGTTGLASQCAPSRFGGAAPSFGVNGVRVATDYIGLGPVGERHGYLSGTSEAHAVIDGVRAARRIAAAHAGRRWVAIGHSQGGHSALFTNELGRSYAPELKLRGTVSVAPAAVLGKTFGPADQIVPRMVGIMALYGWAADYPQIDPNDYVGPQVKAAAGVIDTGCLDQIVGAMVLIPADTFYAHDPRVTEPALTVGTENDPGHVRSRSPLLLISGSADTFVVPARVQYLYEQLCGIGQVTQLTELTGAGHGDELSRGASEIANWLNARFTRQKAPNSCPAR